VRGTVRPIGLLPIIGLGVVLTCYQHAGRGDPTAASPAQIVRTESRGVGALSEDRSAGSGVRPFRDETYSTTAIISEGWKRKSANYSLTCWFLGWGQGADCQL